MMNTIEPTGASPVRIDGAYIPDVPKSGDERAEGTGLPKGAPADPGAGSAEVVRSHQRLAGLAAAADEVNAKAVEEARKLLQSGQLDTDEAAERAARALLEEGM